MLHMVGFWGVWQNLSPLGHVIVHYNFLSVFYLRIFYGVTSNSFFKGREWAVGTDGINKVHWLFICYGKHILIFLFLALNMDVFIYIFWVIMRIVYYFFISRVWDKGSKLVFFIALVDGKEFIKFLLLFILFLYWLNA